MARVSSRSRELSGWRHAWPRLIGPIVFGLATAAQASPVVVGDFAGATGGIPEPWQIVRIDDSIPATQYRIRRWDGLAAVEAQADGSMALLARPIRVDLLQTPVLCWRWRVDNVVASADLETRAGDDYAARVYVAFQIPPEHLSLGLRMKLALGRSLFGDMLPDAALNYVWDNRHPVGTRRFSAYTDRAQLVVQRSGESDAGQWVEERVNVLEDARAAYGDVPFQPGLLAVAADTDNTGESVRAGFADLRFVAADASCGFGAAPG